jgi:hypothetical protein
MQDNKIFGLMAQAEDIQAHAVKLQAATEDALTRLPEAARRTFETVARETFAETAQKASEGLMEASRGARDASVTLRSTGVLVAVFLLGVAIVIGGAGWGVGSYLVSSRKEELADLRQQIAAEKSTLEALQEKSWRLELVNYDDGTRGILLPRGVHVERTGLVKGGREAIVIK